jgi:hypothetical protein
MDADTLRNSRSDTAESPNGMRIGKGTHA